MRERGIGGIEFRMWHDGDIADFAPSLHLNEAVGLALQRSFLDGKSTRCGEEMHQIYGLVDDFCIILFRYEKGVSKFEDIIRGV